MPSPRTLLTLASAALLQVARVHGADILSCADVGCPIVEGTTAANCTVADRSFSAVGLTDLDTGGVNDRLRGLSWVKGVSATDHPANRSRVFDQTFYLGTPDDFDFEDTGACALFFGAAGESVRFGDADPRNSQGTCGQALSDACVSALTDRAKKVDLTGLRGRRACEKLQQDFTDNLDSACSDAAGGNSWPWVSAKGMWLACFWRLFGWTVEADMLWQRLPVTAPLKRLKTGRTAPPPVGRSFPRPTT